MKNIKNFESYYNKSDGTKPIYWKIPTEKPNLILALKKIGVLDETIKLLITNITTLFDYVYIIKRIIKQEDVWTYTYDKNYVIDKEFMGTINIPEEEVATYKYNI